MEYNSCQQADYNQVKLSTLMLLHSNAVANLILINPNFHF